ncbi:hypothetical protein ACFCV9_00845 [Streptomyces sp. NPDC056367]|uniref:hypothetical protein n=1 Tax=Streptomyces sp. NPDC056367 TaxID=3345797 RepID=UPI0035D79191
MQRRSALAAFLDTCSEDELIEQVLLPMFRQQGFHRITAAGHRDKALEYGKDIWMRCTLPTRHFLYFGIQVKRGKLDAMGKSRTGNANVAEIRQQALMMLAHEIFDPETNRRGLPDGAPDVMHALRDGFLNVRTALRSFNTRGGLSAPGDGA